jgi:hypothetical protein
MNTYTIEVLDGSTNQPMQSFEVHADTRGEAVRKVKRILGGSKKMIALDLYIEK